MLPTRLYEQICAFGAFAIDGSIEDAIVRYSRHARVIVDWFDFLQSERAVRFDGAEPFSFPLLDIPIGYSWAGRTSEEGAERSPDY